MNKLCLNTSYMFFLIENWLFELFENIWTYENKKKKNQKFIVFTLVLKKQTYCCRKF